MELFEGERLDEVVIGACFEATVVADGPSALAEFERAGADIVLLDLMLPGMSGTEVCQQLRREGNDVPILMLTARGAVPERVAGLEAGADDYLVKPFALDELSARLRALMRRTSVTGHDDTLQVNDLVLDPLGRTASRAGQPLELTKTEFDLLELLLVNAGVVLARDVIYDRIWGYDFETSSRSLDVYVGYLRSKTEADGASRLVHTVRGVGYVLRP